MLSEAVSQFPIFEDLVTGAAVGVFVGSLAIVRRSLAGLRGREASILAFWTAAAGTIFVLAGVADRA